DVRFERLVVGRQRAILQSRRNPDPYHAVGMHDEWRVARQRVVAAFLFVAPIIGPLRFREIGNVVAAPLPFCLVPPNEFLPLAPRCAVGTRRAAVVENPSIERPGVAPSMSVSSARLSLVRFVL